MKQQRENSKRGIRSSDKNSLDSPSQIRISSPIPFAPGSSTGELDAPTPIASGTGETSVNVTTEEDRIHVVDNESSVHEKEISSLDGFSDLFNQSSEVHGDLHIHFIDINNPSLLLLPLATLILCLDNSMRSSSRSLFLRACACKAEVEMGCQVSLSLARCHNQTHPP